MKNDVFNTLEEQDISVLDGIDSIPNERTISFLLTTHFDINKKFGLNLQDKGMQWDSLYADYNPFENKLKLMYYVCEKNIPHPVGREYIPTREESSMIIKALDQSLVENEGMNCKEYMENRMKEKFNMDYERMASLFGKSLCYIGEMENGKELYDTFHNELGMSNKEISAMGFTSLSEFFDNDIDENPGMELLGG